MVDRYLKHINSKSGCFQRWKHGKLKEFVNFGKLWVLFIHQMLFFMTQSETYEPICSLAGQLTSNYSTFTSYIASKIDCHVCKSVQLLGWERISKLPSPENHQGLCYWNPVWWGLCPRLPSAPPTTSNPAPISAW